MNNKSLVSYIIVTQNRKKQLAETIISLLKQDYEPIEIIVIDNSLDDHAKELFKQKFNQGNIHYFKMKENKGVSGGRNVGIEKATGEILITIDDDAEIKDRKVTQKIVNKFKQNDNIGILTFKVLNYYTQKTQKSAIPNRSKGFNINEESEVTWFIGVCHAVPKKVYNKVGKFKEDFNPYGHEEIDFSFRTINKNYKIIYFPQVEIFHKIKQKRSKRQEKRWEILLNHRIKAAFFNLPLRYIISTTIIWSLRTLINSRFNLMIVYRAISEICKNKNKLITKRHIINKQALIKIKKLGGPLWY